MPASPERTNAQWLTDLTLAGPRGVEAQRALRALLVRGLSRALAGRTDAAALIEDFAQEAVLRILRSLETFRDESRFTTWALAIGLRVAYSDLRRRRYRDVPLESLGDAPEHGASAQAPVPSAMASGRDPERAALRREIIAALDRTLRTTLTDRQRTVIMAELRELPQDEIAARLGITRNAVYKLGHDARRALQRALEEGGFDREGVGVAFEPP